VSAISVLVADDQAIVRAGFSALLDAEADLTVVGQAVDGADAVQLTRRTRPDVVLMDVRMPVMDGLLATTAIRSNPDLASTRVLVLTTFDLDEYVFGALRAGASGYLLKGMEPVDLIRAVHVVAAGEALLAPTATRRLIEAFSAAAVPTAPRRALAVDMTEREREVLRLVARGLTNQEIAHDLCISPLTVKTHVSSLLAKHQLRDRVQLVILGYETGLTPLG